MNSITYTHQQDIQAKEANLKDIENFYNEATEDYRFWSRNYNMHFGYCTFGKTLPFLRETMLTEMNRQVMIRLDLPTEEAKLTDLGCGMGATMKYILKRQSQLQATGITISPYQTEQGNMLLSQVNGHIKNENFMKTSQETASQDGVTAVESFSHAGHHKKALKEAYRILKPGGRFVMTDAFLRETPEKLCKVSHHVYQQLCKGWSLDGLGVIHEVEEELKTIGFNKVKVENVSWRVALSVLHVPFTIPTFILLKLLKGKEVKPQSWKNLKGSFYALLSGLHFHQFGYYIITAEK